MKRISLLFFFILTSRLFGSGFDDTVLWIYDLPDGSSVFFAKETTKICNPGLRASFLYSNPYGIDAIDWNDLFIRKGFGRWGTFARLNSYGLKSRYNRYIYNAGVAIKLSDSISASIDALYHFEHFEGVGGFGRTEGNGKLSYYRGAIHTVVGLTGIKMEENSKSYAPGPRGWGAITYNFKNGTSFSGSVRRFESGRSRWLFSQRTPLARDFGLSIGVINRPDVIFGRLELAHSFFSLELAYYSISRLSDTVVFGFAVGE